MYEIHSTQEGSGTHPGDTFDLDYSLMRALVLSKGRVQIGVGVARYEVRQTTAKTGPQITPVDSRSRYAINALGLAASVAFPKRKLTFGVRFFEEFADRSTYEGHSLQFSGPSVSNLERPGVAGHSLEAKTSRHRRDGFRAVGYSES